MTNPDFSECTETRGGHVIPYPPIYCPIKNAWLFFAVLANGETTFKKTDAKGRAIGYPAGHFNLIPPVEYEWMVAYVGGGGAWRISMDEAQRQAAQVTVPNEGYYRRERGKPETIEFVELEPRGEG